jgi:hypothetical protein
VQGQRVRLYISAVPNPDSMRKSARIYARTLIACASSATAFSFVSAPLGAQPIAMPATPGTRTSGSPAADTLRPFGTLRDQAFRQQRWLKERLDKTLPALMRKRGVDMWVVPMREYNEDPVFHSITSPTTMSARRRTIYVFFDRGEKLGVERLALGGTSQGDLYTAVRSMTPVPATPAGEKTNTRTAELWGDDQWQALKTVIEQRQPKSIAIDVSRTFAFADGLSSGERDGMQAALGKAWTAKMVNADALAIDLIASRTPDEEAMYLELNKLTWNVIEEAFSDRVIKPGVTTADDVVWWMRQRVNDLGLGTWFHPSIEVQRKAGGVALGDNPTIMKGDVLHCDFGITAMGLNTDTQHMAYVLKDGETDVPPGLKKALLNSNRLQDIQLSELVPGHTGNAALRNAAARMKAGGIDGTLYSHPIGLNGHGAGPLIGLWDYQDGVPGRGDHAIIPGMWFSVELQATTPVPEWNNQPVRSAQEEDAIVDATGKARWAFQRQTTFHLIKTSSTLN